MNTSEKTLQLISEFYREYDDCGLEITDCILIATRVARMMKDYSNLLWLELSVIDLSDSNVRSYEEFSHRAVKEEFPRLRAWALQKVKSLKYDLNRNVQDWPLDMLISFPLDMEYYNPEEFDADFNVEVIMVAYSCRKIVNRIKLEVYGYISSLEGMIPYEN